ncbi:MAG TPA: LolA-related protein [Xanthomonadaceae bacterium]|nr:LolA-related protein [Xanthomonadaceae bacterium]
MTSGNATWIGTTLLLALLATAAAAIDPQLDALLARLARPAPAQVAFLELRDSLLLDTPTRTAGTLARPDEGVLVKAVDWPHRETTTIAQENVSVERQGERPRRFALGRAPELEGLLASFDALLGADRERLAHHYRIEHELTGPDWVIALTPRDPRLSRRIAQILLRGSGDALRCMELSETSGARTTTLLGSGLDALREAEADALRAHCRTGTAQ